MTPKILSLAAAAAIAFGAGAAPAMAAMPATRAATAPTAPKADAGRVIPVNHLYRGGYYCRRQYRLGFVFGRRGARIYFRRHCRNRYHYWDRGYRRGYWRRHHRYRGYYGYDWRYRR